VSVCTSNDKRGIEAIDLIQIIKEKITSAFPTVKLYSMPLFSESVIKKTLFLFYFILSSFHFIFTNSKCIVEWELKPRPLLALYAISTEI
jgi:hypothetical protein